MALVVTAAALLPGRGRLVALAGGAAALTLAWRLDSGTGRLRVQGAHLAAVAHRVLDTREGPDATVSVVEYAGRARSQ